jgi:hypothetical protein
MRRLLFGFAGLGLIAASVMPGGLFAAGPQAPSANDVVLVTTVTPTPTPPKVLCAISNQRLGKGTPGPCI